MKRLEHRRIFRTLTDCFTSPYTAIALGIFATSFILTLFRPGGGGGEISFHFISFRVKFNMEFTSQVVNFHIESAHFFGYE